MNLSISPTRDPDLLDDYYELRQRCFRRELGVVDFDGSEDSWDRCSDILIAQSNGRCVGGARITVSSAEHRRRLPVEAKGMMLCDRLPTLQLAERSYAQVTRLAVSEKERSQDMLRALGSAIMDHAIAQGCDYLFGISGMARSRIYRRIFRARGFEYTIHTGVPVAVSAAFRRLPHYLGSGDLRGSL